MRVITWNVCDAFRQKFGHLERLRPDIAVLQEIRPVCIEYAGLHHDALWVGDAGQKGLSVISYNGWKLKYSETVTTERWFMPLEATRGEDRVRLVAVWVDSSRDCTQPTLRALADLHDFIVGGPCIVAGDFNQTVTMDRRKGQGRRFADVLMALDELGLESSWHTHKREQQGAESAATLHWTWNQEKRFHIDFAFASKGLIVEDASLGTYEQYVAARISDHVPLTVAYRLGAAA